MSDHLPPEILVQILHRLPAKSLAKCTSVCKAWKSLITDHAFICDHLTHTIQDSNHNAPLLFQLYTETSYLPRFTLTDEFYSLYSDNEETDHLSILRFPIIHQMCMFGDSTLVGTCNGLVCFAEYSVLNRATQIIWNPSIWKYVELPKPSATFRKRNCLEERYQVIYGFGFDSRNKDFKLVRIVTLRREEATPQVDIYSLASGSWRSVAATAPPLFLFKHFWEGERKPQMFVNGVLHWVVNRRSNGQIHDFILTFDVSEETFGELKLPQCLKESHFGVSLLEGGNSLAVLHRNAPDSGNKFFSIRVMKEYGAVESWTQVFHSDSTQYGGISNVLALRSSGEVVLNSLRDGIVLLDPVKELVKKLELGGFFMTFIGCYVQSLFLINKEPDVLSNNCRKQRKSLSMLRDKLLKT